MPPDATRCCPSLHQVPPVESPPTSGVPSRDPSYIRCPNRVSPYIRCLNRVSPYIRCPQPTKSLLTSGAPRQQSPSLHQVPPASVVPPYIRCPLFTRVLAAGDLASAPLQETSSWRPKGRGRAWVLLFFLPQDSWSSVNGGWWRQLTAGHRPLTAAAGKKRNTTNFARHFPEKQ